MRKERTHRQTWIKEQTPRWLVKWERWFGWIYYSLMMGAIIYLLLTYDPANYHNVPWERKTILIVGIPLFGLQFIHFWVLKAKAKIEDGLNEDYLEEQEQERRRRMLSSRL